MFAFFGYIILIPVIILEKSLSFPFTYYLLFLCIAYLDVILCLFVKEFYLKEQSSVIYDLMIY